MPLTDSKLVAKVLNHASREIKMPALSPTMEEGTLAKWLVADGDEVRSGIDRQKSKTDKATMEVEAIEDGKIGQIFGACRNPACKGKSPVIAILLEDGENASDMTLPAYECACQTVAAPVADDTTASAKQHNG